MPACPSSPIVFTNEKSNLFNSEKKEAVLDVNVSPNPTANYFNLIINSSDKNTPIECSIIDGSSRTIEVRKSIYSGNAIIIGEEYASGIYFALITQGRSRKVMKLVKK
jgi:chondroitin-sulfate-ABC endolyase/exolyase